jgi:AraC-like DNA-binding protein
MDERATRVLDDLAGEYQYPSLIGRLADLALSADLTANTTTNSEEGLAMKELGGLLRNERERTFHQWLGWSVEQQFADIRAHLGSNAADRECWLTVASYGVIVPLGADDAERALFFCDIEAILAVLRNDLAEACGSGDWRVRSALDLVARECGKSALSLKSMAGRLRISGPRLSLLCRRSTGLGFRQYARVVRIRRAVDLMKWESNPTAAEIARMLGYSDLSNFVRDFRNTLGRTPGEFRNLIASWSG